MPCPKCALEPGYHRFQKFAQIGGTDLFYSAPPKTDTLDETRLDNFRLHLKEDTQHRPWIWIVDCTEMQLKHYTEVSFNIGLLQLLANNPNLREIWVIQPNIWVRTTISFLRSFSSAKILENITYIDRTRLERTLRERGVNDASIAWLLNQ